MSNQITGLYYICIVCDARNEIINNIELNEIIDCEECASELEVTNLSPFEVVEIDMDAEDWGQ